MITSSTEQTSLNHPMTYEDGKWMVWGTSKPEVYSEPRLLYGGPSNIQDFTGLTVWVKPGTSNMVLKYHYYVESDYYKTMGIYTSTNNATGHFQPFMALSGPVKEHDATIWTWKDMDFAEIVQVYNERSHIWSKKKLEPGKNCVF